jgi:hypothetical protein
LSTSASVAADASLLNSDQPIKVVLGTKSLPRLSEGINQAVPEVAPSRYRGYVPPAGDSNSITKERTAENLAPLLHQIFFQLDAPDTFDPAWDQQAGTNSWTQLSRSAFEVSPIVVAEERWARKVTEMLLLTVYRGPESLYGAFNELEIL